MTGEQMTAKWVFILMVMCGTGKALAQWQNSADAGWFFIGVMSIWLLTREA
jgi:hypothetical protein